MAKAAKCDVCGKLYEPYGFRICFNDGCGEHDIRVRCEEFDPSYDDHLNRDICRECLVKGMLENMPKAEGMNGCHLCGRINDKGSTDPKDCDHCKTEALD